MMGRHADIPTSLYSPVIPWILWRKMLRHRRMEEGFSALSPLNRFARLKQAPRRQEQENILSAPPTARLLCYTDQSASQTYHTSEFLELHLLVLSETALLATSSTLLQDSLCCWIFFLLSISGFVWLNGISEKGKMVQSKERGSSHCFPTSNGRVLLICPFKGCFLFSCQWVLGYTHLPPHVHIFLKISSDFS